MINITVSGDFAPNKKLLDAIAEDPNYFESILPYLGKSDLNITNLECPIIEKETPASKYGPSLATDTRAVRLLEQGGFELVTLANNHIMDHGVDGLINTVQKLTEHSILKVGAGENVKKASEPFIFEKNSKKVGIMNIAENEFSNTVDHNPGAAPLDLIENARTIKALKQKVDFVMVIVHGGAELHQYPSPRFKNTLRFMAEQGANLVVAHHTHCYNGYEIYDNTPIFYGLGNFVFPTKGKIDRNWSLGVLLTFQINEDLSVDFKTIPFMQNYQSFDLKVLQNDELDDFREKEQEKNKIILDDQLLAEQFDLFYKRVEKQYLHYLQPYTSKYLHKLYSLGILPSFLNNKTKKLLYLNLIRCEAHRDIVLKLLK